MFINEYNVDFGMSKHRIDSVIYIAAIGGPLMNLPQLFKIWISKSANGVSLLSWSGFAVISLMWVYYGYIHKNKPILLMNSALFVIQTLIATGTLLYG